MHKILVCFKNYVVLNMLSGDMCALGFATKKKRKKKQSTRN